MRPLLFMAWSLTVAASAAAQTKITSPQEQFGFNLGDDYQLANYKQLVEYWKKLDRESDRMSVVPFGTTAEGRPMLMAVITSPENHRKLERYQAISRRLALAEGLTEEEALRLAAEGRAVVWIDGGLHATEVLGAQQLMEQVYQMASRTDEETLRILNDVVMLAACVNPDGMDLVVDWYMREADPAKRSTDHLPRLYHKYVGHDNNRDFYMSSQPETEAINRIFFHEWFPQIVYNHHQSGPAGTVMFAPPFRDPFNHNYDPLIPLGIDLVGAAMHGRFSLEGKPGVTMRSGANYSTWWNGGLRTTVYFHNIIGLLTETIGHPTPMEIPFLPEKQLASADLPNPIAPQKWHFRQSIDYSITANRAVLDVASRHREQFLFNIYRMGRNSIERGSRDSWTRRPKDIEAVQQAIVADKAEWVGRGRYRGRPLKYYETLNDPQERDPRGYVIPSDQPDFLTAIKFMEVLHKNGVAIHRAKAAFSAAGKSYPAGSFVVKAAQAFRPHVLDMFEPQDHPDDILYPGGPPKPPYDSAGWTLAYQMGVQFERILEDFDGPFERLTKSPSPPPGGVSGSTSAAGYFLSHEVNDAFLAVNRLLAGGEKVLWLKSPVSSDGRTHPAGTMYIPARATTRAKLETLASATGLSFEATAFSPAGDTLALEPVRIGLWDRYGGSMPSGWVRFLLERYEFPFEVVYASTLNASDLRDKYDVLVFVDGAIPGGGDDADEPRFGPPPPKAESIPAEFHDWLENVTVEKTLPRLRDYVEAGGTIVAIGSSAQLASHWGLPVSDALVEAKPNEPAKRLPREKFYVPGSILRVRVDNQHPLAYGMPENVDVYFDNSPVFRLAPDASLKKTGPVAWFADGKPLRSGWAWGQNYLAGGVAVLEAGIGKGKLFLFGPEITFRAQPHGTFKFLFNGIYAGVAHAVGQTPTTESAQARR
jgi:hypothetical protein